MATATGWWASALCSDSASLGGTSSYPSMVTTCLWVGRDEERLADSFTLVCDAGHQAGLLSCPHAAALTPGVARPCTPPHLSASLRRWQKRP